MGEADKIPKVNLTRKIVVDLSIMTAIGIFLAFIGPFGSIEAPLPTRLASWVFFAWIGYAIYSPMTFFVERLSDALELPEALLWVLAVALATVPMTAAVWMIGFVPNLAPLPSLEQALTSYFYVFLVGGAITGFFYLLEMRKAPVEGVAAGEQGSSVATATATSPVVQPRLVARLSSHLGSEIIALEMEDHYVRVHTALGSDLVLMRMRDAVAELDGIEGHQVHRSWWVARGSVEDVLREGRNIRLRLTNAVEAPVSRAQVRPLKEAGWI